MAQVFRYEEKHLINRRQYEIIKRRLNKLFQIDQFTAGENEYHIRSVYFDDYIKKSVYDNVQGLKERYKYRIRYYNLNTDIIKLEKKVKNNEQGYKKVIALSKDEYLELINRKVDLLSKREEPLAKEFVLFMKIRLLKPIIMIEYHREPYLLPFNDIRVTFDKHITYSTKEFYKEEKLDHVSIFDDNIVLEIKYNHFLPSHIRALFNIDSIQKMSISKYLLCYQHSTEGEYQL